MLDLFASWLEFVGLSGAHLLAAVVAIAFGSGFTQALKKTAGFGGSHAFLTAIASTFAAAYTLTPPEGLQFSWTSLWLSLATAFAAPTLYKVAIVIVRKRWPDVAKAISGG